MATYKVTYLDEIPKEYYIKNVVDEHDALDVCDAEHPEISKSIKAKIELISE